MVLVDTSVWVDFFRNPAADYNYRLEGLIRGQNRVAICGIVLQEILQGIRDRESYQVTRQRLLFLPFFEAGREVHLLAASLYRDLRKKGITVPSTDALIAAAAIHHGSPILSGDQHFVVIAANSQLQLFA
ncbi:MAG: hypothetical protein A2075_12750 [Geobacteraceae bacterium GWC2_58_44]|nr:MAG: hypothetical protein A2075_12750 [Geobacteraceae bacterium GWC2_58_44]HBG05604.1 PIN domain nuclease [Geobacter sp.]